MSALLGLLFAAQAMPAMAMPAGEPAVACARQAAVAGFEGWGRGPAANVLAVGRPAALRLQPAVSTPAGATPPSARAVKEGTFGGSFALHVDRAGFYRVGLSAGAWIDVLQSGHPLNSAAHMRGPACSGIAKIVTFQLQPGDYVVQLAEAKADGILAMVVTGYGEKPAG